MWCEVIVLFLIIFANGFFALSELAILSANKTRLRLFAKDDHKGARQALDLAENSENFLPAIQSCISLCSAFAGVFSGAEFAQDLGDWLNQFPYLAPHGAQIALPIIVLVVSYFSMVLGELVPKQLAVNDTERWAMRMAPLVAPLVRWFMPGVHVLRGSTHLMLRLFPGRHDRAEGVSEEEVKALVDEGTEDGVFEIAEQQMIKRVLRLADRPVRAIMTARGEVDWLDIHAKPADLMKQIHAARHSAYPVCDGSLDHALGVIRAKDLLDQAYSGQAVDLRAVMQDAAIIPETASVLSILEKIKLTTIHMGFVVDEYGVLEGIVTELDILESIIGELPDDEDDAAPLPIAPRHDGSLMLDGATAIDEVKTELDIQELPGEETYHTLGGIMLGRIGRIPRVGDGFEYANWRFEITAMDGRRVDKVLAKFTPPKESTP
jgi:putative hemolysin